MGEDGKKAKKEKKEKKRALEAAAAAEEDAKAAKKARKAAKKAAAAAAAAAPAVPAAAAEAGGDDDAERKRLKKEKKKAAKAAKAEKEGGVGAAAAAAAAAVAPPAEEKKTKKDKKDKKDKKVWDGAGKGPGGLAAVGDRALAASGAAFQRAFYTPAAEVAALSTKDVAALRDKVGLSLEDCPGPDLAPVRTFAEAGFPADVLAATKTFKQPSPIQAQSWPVVLSGHDMIGIAATGSGKTMAFGLPGLVHIKAQPKTKPGSPVCLVLAPTRELAQQTARVLESAGAACGITCACVYGGESKQVQRKALREGGGAAIVVATPGRLQDFMEEGDIKLDRVTYFVLDEADRMLDLGFEPAIRAIAGNIRADRQTLMFSATWPQSIQALAAEFLSSPAKVRIGEEGLKASHSVQQIVEVVDPHEKEEALQQLLQQYHAPKRARVLIFALYKKEAARLHLMLRNRWGAICIHGDMQQAERTRAVEAFKDGSSPLLIATDVAARGLDIPGVECVINYTFPLTTEDYVHRIGRTGRAGATGVAHTLFTLHDKARAGELVNVLREAGANVPPELTKFGTHVKKKESKLYGAHFKDVDMTQKAKKITFD